MNKTTLFAIGLILVAAFSRFLPHPPNFTAMGAIALFAGRFLPNRVWALLVPLAAVALTDWIFGFYPGWTFVYGAYALIVLLGWRLRRQSGVWPVVAAGISTSGIFFVLSNIGVWWTSEMYSHDLKGLVSCFVAALPFIHYTIMSDGLFILTLFGAYVLAKRMLLNKSAAALEHSRQRR